MPNVAGGRAGEPAGGVALAELGHIEADERLLRAKEGLGQGLGQLGLAHAGGPQKEKRTNRTVGFLQPGPAAADGAGDGPDGSGLSRHPAA